MVLKYWIIAIIKSGHDQALCVWMGAHSKQWARVTSRAWPGELAYPSLDALFDVPQGSVPYGYSSQRHARLASQKLLAKYGTKIASIGVRAADQSKMSVIDPKELIK